jgi:hypothetical protein
MRRRRAFPALFAVMLLVVGQLAALAHEASTRHITCAQHGEELEAATLVGELHACDHDHLFGVEGNAGEHADCPIARAFHQSTQTSRFAVAPLLVPHVAPSDVVAAGELTLATSGLYLIAPKTSPPARLLRSFIA